MPQYGSVSWFSIGSGNGLSPAWHQAITWTNVVALSIRLLGTNFSEILIRILWFSLTNMYLKSLCANMVAILSRGRWVNFITILHKRHLIALYSKWIFVTLSPTFHYKILNNAKVWKWVKNCFSYPFWNGRVNFVLVCHLVFCQSMGTANVCTNSS